MYMFRSTKAEILFGRMDAYSTRNRVDMTGENSSRHFVSAVISRNTLSRNVNIAFDLFFFFFFLEVDSMADVGRHVDPG